MKQYRKEQDQKDESLVTVWNDEEGIGLRFHQGQALQRYLSDIVIKEGTSPTVETLSKVGEELTDYAASLYPTEFKEIQQP